MTINKIATLVEVINRNGGCPPDKDCYTNQDCHKCIAKWVEEQRNFLPVGLKPKWISDIERLREVQGAIARYYDAEKVIPIEWIEEYNELIRATEEKRRRINNENN